MAGDSTRKGPVIPTFDVPFVVRPDKVLNKQSTIELSVISYSMTPMWRHCNDNVAKRYFQTGYSHVVVKDTLL